MSKTLIEAYPKFEKPIPTEPYLKVAEFYMDTIQGEGIYAGVPAAFLRLQGCHVGCSFCDTKEVWREGNPYTFHELFKIIRESGLAERFTQKQHHLVITGGAPLLQQDSLIMFFDQWLKEFGWFPFIEIENESTIVPKPELVDYISCWNNSPKLFSSGVLFKIRYKVLAIAAVSELNNSWFKFVISDPERDWEEIKENFLDCDLMHRGQIILMPQGATAKELADNREEVIDLAIREGVRYSTREHIVVWGKKTGV
jgi:6-pyruvoyltetrahydropterin 2'-reductase